MTTEFTRRVMLGALPGLGLAGVAAAQSTGSRISRPVDIAAYLQAWVDTYGRPTAKVMVNGAGPFSFMVDTGASVIALNERSAAQIGVRPRPSDYTAMVSTANGSIKAARTRRVSASDRGGGIALAMNANIGWTGATP